MTLTRPTLEVRSQRQDRGVLYELTQLEISDRAWWSIAFEMAEQEAMDRDRFENAVSRMDYYIPLAIEFSQFETY
jgi:hypothetical protein